MRIRLAFSDDDTADGEMPTLISAVDEYTEDNWGKVPDWHTKELSKYTNVREVTVIVRDEDVRVLFAVPTIDARIDNLHACYECGHEVDAETGEQHGRSGWVHHACMRAGL